MPFVASVEGNFGYASTSIVRTPLAGSLLFNGSTAYLKATPGVTLGSGAYTVECWFYNNSSWSSSPPVRSILGGGTDGTTGCISIFFPTNTTITTDGFGGQGQRSYTVAPISLNAWHHFVIVRNASQVETVFIDGVKAVGCSGGSAISGGQQTNNINYSGTSMNIGHYYQGYWAGYITNMRIVVGTAVYNPTAASIATPIAPLTNVANTKYLMLGATVTTDDSSTQTITNPSNLVTQSAVKPF
jgi:hypothetical protein